MRNDEPEHNPTDRPILERLDARHYGDDLEQDDRPVPPHVGPTPEDETYRWECVCGWSIEREKRAANLPESNNKRIARVVAECHENRPRFGDSADETHEVCNVDTDRTEEDGE